MKVCTKCHIEKGLSEYGKHPHGKFGVTSICKSCIREYRRKYHRTDAYKKLQRIKRAKNPEKYRERDKKRNHTEKRRAWRREYYQKTIDKQRTSKIESQKRCWNKAYPRIKKWVSENPDKRKNAQKRYAESHREIISAKRREREVVGAQKLSEDYLIRRVRQETGLTAGEIRKMPILLEKKKLDILIHRANKIIKQHKNKSDE